MVTRLGCSLGTRMVGRVTGTVDTPVRLAIDSSTTLRLSLSTVSTARRATQKRKRKKKEEKKDKEERRHLRRITAMRFAVSHSSHGFVSIPRPASLF